MTKLDLTKHYKTYFSAGAKPELVHIEDAQFIAICGKGDPSEKSFKALLTNQLFNSNSLIG